MQKEKKKLVNNDEGKKQRWPQINNSQIKKVSMEECSFTWR